MLDYHPPLYSTNHCRWWDWGGRKKLPAINFQSMNEERVMGGEIVIDSLRRRSWEFVYLVMFMDSTDFLVNLWSVTFINLPIFSVALLFQDNNEIILIKLSRYGLCGMNLILSRKGTLNWVQLVLPRWWHSHIHLWFVIKMCCGSSINASAASRAKGIFHRRSC